MRITKELDRKLYDAIKAKYAKQYEALDEQKTLIKNTATAKYLRITQVHMADPVFKELLIRIFNARYGNTEPVENIIKRYIDYIPEVAQQLDDLRQQDNALDKARETEHINAMVALAYTKSLDDIKKVFEELGLTF